MAPSQRPSPKVSVILPIYNVERYLSKCLTSVIEQTHENLQIIAIDDGSTDNSGFIADQFANKDSRIVVVHKENGGYGSAVNKGFGLANGDYIAIVETDDYIAHNMYELLVTTAQKHGADVSRCGHWNFREDGFMEACEALGHNRDFFTLAEYPEFIVSRPAIWSAIYRKTLIDDNHILMLDQPKLSYQDVDFFVRTTSKARTIACIPDCLYFYRTETPTSSSNSQHKLHDILNNYISTDEFIENSILSTAIRNHYFRRKLCDLKWHFERVGMQNKREFALSTSNYLKNSSTYKLFGFMPYRQLVFYFLIRHAPLIYSTYRNLKHRIHALSSRH